MTSLGPQRSRFLLPAPMGPSFCRLLTTQRREGNGGWSLASEIWRCWLSSWPDYFSRRGPPTVFLLAVSVDRSPTWRLQNQGPDVCFFVTVFSFSRGAYLWLPFRTNSCLIFPLPLLICFNHLSPLIRSVHSAFSSSSIASSISVRNFRALLAGSSSFLFICTDTVPGS